MEKLARAAWIWLPPLALMGLIFTASSMTSDDVDRPLLDVLLRKGIHFAAYAVLLLLWWRALRTVAASRAAVGLALAITVAYAVTDELHQTQVDGRIGSPVDVAIDTAGALAAATLVVRRRHAVRA